MATRDMRTATQKNLEDRAAMEKAIIERQNIERSMDMFVLNPGMLTEDRLKAAARAIDSKIGDAFLRGDFSMDRSVFDFGKNERVMVQITDPAKLDAPLGDCPCAACTTARANIAASRRRRQREEIAYAYEKARAAGLSATPQALPVEAAVVRSSAPPPAQPKARANKCDCPGCNPSQRAYPDPRAEHPVVRATRFAGLNTPDRKMLGSAQYIGE